MIKKKNLMFVGDFVEKYDAMVPFQLLMTSDDVGTVLYTKTKKPAKSAHIKSPQEVPDE